MNSTLGSVVPLAMFIDSLCISSNAAAGRWNKEGTVKVSGTQFGRCLPSASKRCPRGVPFGRFFLFVLSPRRPIWSGRQAGQAGGTYMELGILRDGTTASLSHINGPD